MLNRKPRDSLKQALHKEKALAKRERRAPMRVEKAAREPKHDINIVLRRTQAS
jgi:hypothetical protein